MFAFLSRVLLLRWLFGRRDRRHTYPSRTYWRGAPPRGHGGRRGSRGGFGMFGPVPTYSRRTRRGTRVSVGGCCLPIPLALSALLVALARIGRSRVP